MSENNNMKFYDMGKSVPDNAKTPIIGGRMKGKTNINCQWRIEKLTEIFGPAGKGWKTKTINKQIIEGANGEKIAIVDIELYVKYDSEWSDAIEGSGGSSFIAKEKDKMYTSDECFKMAYSDALSVACKSVGIGSEIYRGLDESKYSSPKYNTTNTNTNINTNTSNESTSEILSKIKLILWEVAQKDKEKTIELLEKYTSFIGKDGKEVKGVTDIKKLSEGRLKATYGKLTKEFPDISKKVKEDIAKNLKQAK
jgi:hypothetical protein